MADDLSQDPHLVLLQQPAYGGLLRQTPHVNAVAHAKKLNASGSVIRLSAKPFIHSATCVICVEMHNPDDLHCADAINVPHISRTRLNDACSVQTGRGWYAEGAGSHGKARKREAG